MPSWDDLLTAAPPTRSVGAAVVRQAIADAGQNQVLIVLDDDPTGTQSVADLPVLLSWSDDDFRWAFAQGAPAVYVMTNSRSLAPDAAAQVTREVVTVAARVAQELQREAVFVSRSDSTLRGHFPLETDVIQDALGDPNVGIVVIPAFPEAGRITVTGVHYCRVGEDYLPVGESEFANDATFGYKSSFLPDWVEEKTGGRVSASEVVVLDVAKLRGDPNELLATISSAGSAILVADGVTDEDQRALELALIQAERDGHRFVYRVGPPFVRARIGQEVRPPLTSSEIVAAREASAIVGDNTPVGGLIVVGSHVGVTQRQLAHLKTQVSAKVIEIDVASVLDPNRRQAHLDSCVTAAIEAIQSESVIVQTSRKLILGANADDSLAISREVSAAVVSVVGDIVDRVRPAFVLAKGGITSSDVASKALRMRRAIALGSMLPGMVSLWLSDSGAGRGIPYVVFPGNVGGDSALAEVVVALHDSV